MTIPVPKVSANIFFPRANIIEPIEIRGGEIRAGIIERKDAATFTGDWAQKQQCGVYILLSDISKGNFDIYVGFTQSSFKTRFIKDHLPNKPFWTRAVMFASPLQDGMSSTEAKWLEGDLIEEFKKFSNVQLVNSQTSGDETISEASLHNCHKMKEGIMLSLSLLGFYPQESSQLTLPNPPKPLLVSPQMPIQEPQTLNPPTAIQPAKRGLGSIFSRQKQQVNEEVEPKIGLSDEEKFNKLREWRKEETKKHGLNAAYLVFDNKTLKEIVRQNPSDKNKLGQIFGVGDVKLEKHGESLLSFLERLH